MVMEGRRVEVRSRRALTDNDISKALEDSEFDFSDPEFIPPEPSRRCNDHHTSESDSTSNEDDDMLVPPAASPALSSDSEFAYSSRSRSRGRGGSFLRGRGRGRERGRGKESQRRQSLSLSTRQISIRNRQNNDYLQDTWTKDTLEPEMNDLMQPAYIYKETKDWEWNQFYDQYIDDDILQTIVNCTNRTQVLETGKSIGLTLRKLNLGTKLITDNEESDNEGEDEEYEELEKIC